MLSMSAIRSKLRMTSLPSERSCSSSIWSGTRIRLRAAEAKSKHPPLLGKMEAGGQPARTSGGQWHNSAASTLTVPAMAKKADKQQASCVQQRTTSPAHDLRAFPSGPNKPQIPVFSRETWQRDLAHLENREIVGVLENAVCARGGW